jgi:hypothetical protein
MNETIQILHKIYCQFSGCDISMGFGRERDWQMFIKAGFDEEDLRLVLIYLSRGIATGKRNPGCVKFSNVVQNLDYFEEDLALARAYVCNNQPKTNRQAVIKMFMPEAEPEHSPDSCKLAGDVMAKLLAEMRKEAK